MKKKAITLTALSILSLIISSCEDQKKQKPEEEMVKCYGIAQKGKNDCGNALGKHGCAGEATTNDDPCEWVAVKKAECKSKGGTVGPKNCVGAKEDTK